MDGWRKSDASEVLLLLGDTRLDTDAILKVEQGGFLMDWLWGVKVELVPLVCYPIAIRCSQRGPLVRRSLLVDEEGEPLTSANSL